MGLVRRRRPLLRAAAVGGGAYAMGKRHAEREAEEATVEPAQPAQGNGLSAGDIERLQELSRLHDQGVLTDEELAEQKARILG